jgi:hypothetical protein
MGIFSSISNAVSKAVTTVKSAVSSYVNTPAKTQYSLKDQIQGTIKNPLPTLLGTPPTAMPISQGSFTTQIALPTSLKSSAVSLVKQAVIPETIKGAVVRTGLGVGAVMASSALIESPKMRDDALRLPQSIWKAGTGLGSMYEDPSLKNIANVGKENPLLTAASAAAILLVGSKVLQGYSSWTGSQAAKRAADATEDLVKQGNKDTPPPKDKIAEVTDKPSSSQTIVNIYNQPPPATDILEKPLTPIPTGGSVTTEQVQTPKKKTTKKKAKKKKPKKKSKKYIKKKKPKRKKRK